MGRTTGFLVNSEPLSGRLILRLSITLRTEPIHKALPALSALGIVFVQTDGERIGIRGQGEIPTAVVGSMEYLAIVPERDDASLKSQLSEVGQ